MVETRHGASLQSPVVRLTFFGSCAREGETSFPLKMGFYRLTL